MLLLISVLFFLLLSPFDLLRSSVGLTALSVAVILVILRGEQVFYLAVAGSFFLLFYTWPLKYYGLGEISVFIVWGLLMIGGAYFTITKEVFHYARTVS